MQGNLTNKERKRWEAWKQRCSEIQAGTSIDIQESEVEKHARIERAKKDYAFFVEYYYPHYCSRDGINTPTADFHIKASKLIKKDKNGRFVFKWARGHAKTTHMTIFIPMWLKIQDEREINNMVIVGKSQDSAMDLLYNLQAEFESNQRYINDFGTQTKHGFWAKDEFVTNDDVHFVCKGRGQSPRGLNYKGKRPDYIVIDDIDDDEMVLNKDRVKKATNWVLEALYGCFGGKGGRMVIVGNLISKQSVLQNLSNNPRFVTTQVDIIDKDGNPSWEVMWSRERIKEAEETMGTRSFQKEYMNNPTAEGDVFKEMVWGKCPPLSKFRLLVNYCDPSPSNNTKAKNSLKSGFLLGMLDNTFYVLDGYLDRATNAEFVDWIFNINNSVPEGVQVYNYVENNTFQNPFFEQVIVPTFQEKSKKYQKIINIIPDGRKKPDKFSRIEANLEPLNREKRLILNIAKENDPHFKRLEEQFLGITPQLSLPADGPDGIEGGVWKLKEKLFTEGVGAASVGGKKTNNKRI